MPLNIEIKARCKKPDLIREILAKHKAIFRGEDFQVDTYFKVSQGRLKLREGKIENNLIFYDRPDQAGPKRSNFQLVKVEQATALKKALESACGIKMVVGKKREIYFIENVKFHIDKVEGLGDFVEIEAGNLLAPYLTEEELNAQCDFYLKEFNIDPGDLVHNSYSDMLLKGAVSGL